MALVDMKLLLEQAQAEGYGVGAFSVANMEMVLGAIKAAEEKNAPIILQIAEVRLPFSPLEMIGPMMIAAAKTAKVPVAVHLDHGIHIEVIQQALELGFTSVMMDASHLPLEDNIRIVNEVKELAKIYSASVEAEVGQIGGSEDGVVDRTIYYSQPKDVLELYESTKVDAIALSIGNAHGLYKHEPNLQFHILEEANTLIPIPLVLHGGSGISDEDFKTSIAKGIRKINIATSNFMAVENSARSYSRSSNRDYFALSSEMVNGMYENVKHHICIFGSENKARRLA